MRIIVFTVMAASVLAAGPIARGQGKVRALVAVWAHADDEGPVAPILARYAREGVQVHMIIATDGAQGAANTSVPRGPEIAKLRVEEGLPCSAQALGIDPLDLARVPRRCAWPLQRGPRTPVSGDATRARGTTAVATRRPDHMGARWWLWPPRPPHRQQHRDATRAARRPPRPATGLLRLSPR